MGHDVYICYDENDEELCDTLCRVFEDNGIKPWVKPKHNPSISKTEITNAIADSKAFVLIYSKNSRDKNFAVTETDIAFSRNVPIILVNTDNSKLARNLEFIMETQTEISPIADSKRQLEIIVEKTSKIISKPSSSIRIDKKAAREFEKSNPYRKTNLLKKFVKIAIPILALLILVYFLVILPAGQNTTDDGIFSMNVTGVEITEVEGSYHYKVQGESYNMPSDSQMYFMNIKFFDNEDNEIHEVNSTADEFKYGTIASCTLKEKNITHIGFMLTDLKGNVLSQEDYEIE
jgi:hypothetical protein